MSVVLQRTSVVISGEWVWVCMGLWTVVVWGGMWVGPAAAELPFLAGGDRMSAAAFIAPSRCPSTPLRIAPCSPWRPPAATTPLCAAATNTASPHQAFFIVYSLDLLHTLYMYIYFFVFNKEPYHREERDDEDEDDETTRMRESH